ncbi:hypothetical protein Golomagni_01126 [Golovinomyces magnicellulatus]|nr:hypothetical protein Golomagni_01126 [Golovinomyces magnicellulatus]
MVVLKYTLRFKDRGLVDVPSESLETVIEIAAQYIQVNDSYLFTGQTNILSYGRDELFKSRLILVTNVDFKATGHDHYPPNLNRLTINKRFTWNHKGRLERGASNLSRKFSHELQQYKIKLQYQWYMGKPNYWTIARGKGKNRVSAKEEEKLFVEDSADLYYGEESLDDTEDDYLQNYTQQKFIDINREDFEVSDQERLNREDDNKINLAEENSKDGILCPPNREGSNQSHPLFKALVNGVNSTIFLDYDSNSSCVF